MILYLMFFLYCTSLLCPEIGFSEGYIAWLRSLASEIYFFGAVRDLFAGCFAVDTYTARCIALQPAPLHQLRCWRSHIPHLTATT